MLTVHMGEELGGYLGEKNYIVIADGIREGHKRALSVLQKQGKLVLFDDISKISFDELQKLKEVETLNLYGYTGGVFPRT